MWGKRFWLRELWYLMIGTTLMALAVNLVYDPLGMVPGGFSGAAILFEHISAQTIRVGIPVWLINLILNVPVFLFGMRIRGREYIAKSLFANLFFSAMLYLIPVMPVEQEDYFLAAVVGGTLTGVGIGLVFAAGYSTGGTDLLSSLLQRFMPHYPVAHVLFFLDAVIILAGAAYFGVDKAVYAAVAVYLSSKIMDGILSGLHISKQVLIISKHYEEIGDAILQNMNRGVTELQARGRYSRTERPALLCVVGRRQIGRLLEIVKEQDAAAFIVITDVKEVIGEGFGQTLVQ